ncbi:GNAT family N-acetyltransferase [Glycomyces algeriensis]|uniref:Ribosomal-protein-alanine acetyltransferase n=1 Tax=Glycomyces algeriensis TaxID=256037 RepID=A0A9W6GCZ3_9ACTN|nr:GNAT family protein [Glycomyces algeriensis]MDA1368266.1 GNAT family protein [Glycomyces algeriensis]MDR7351906.1 ribosomal-protein-alanine N-acetyltransferase [Glycomyces algeriensis]GLI44636.1 ribosomal-protein-alanine acetyltransferase [Glycomyces algeriensis]
MITIRPIALEDAEPIAALRRESRDHLAPWEPERGEASYTAAGVREAIEAAFARAEAGTGLTYAIEDDGRVAGQIFLNSIVRGPYFRSCSTGYWVAKSAAGRGVATEAVRLAKRIAFEDLGLLRVQAETLVDNHASQKVLQRNGFEPIGMAPAYLKIAGRWQDHLLFQVLNPALAAGTAVD